MTTIGKFGLGIVIIIITAFLLVNVNVAFGPKAEVVKSLLILFLILGNTFMVLSGRRPDILTADFSKILLFLVGFLATAFVMVLITVVIPVVFFADISYASQALSFGFVYAFVIAFWEEMIFRDILPKGFGLSDVTANITFAFFHLAALTAIIGFNLMLMMTAFIVLFSLGMVWAQVRDRFGIMASVGSHAAYNMVIMSPTTIVAIVVFIPYVG